MKRIHHLGLRLFVLYILTSCNKDDGGGILLPQPGSLEVVANLPICPGNVAVAPSGRIFASVHQYRSPALKVIEITGGSSYIPYPDENWNATTGQADHIFHAVLGIYADTKNRLWILDNGFVGDTLFPPKLLAFDITTGNLLYRHHFPEEVGPKGTVMQDLAVDPITNFVYIADIGGLHDPAIVVVDVNNNRSRRFTSHPALKPMDVDLVAEGRVITGFDPGSGERVAVRNGINPITLSSDRQTLYFGAMNGTLWYLLPTLPLRNFASDEIISGAIKEVGPKPVSDGAATDKEGNHYFTDVANNAITRLSTDGTLTTLVEDNRLIWPDNVRFGPDSWLYVCVTQLNRSPIWNNGNETARLPFQIMRIKTGTEGSY